MFGRVGATLSRLDAGSLALPLYPGADAYRAAVSLRDDAPTGARSDAGLQVDPWWADGGTGRRGRAGSGVESTKDFGPRSVYSGAGASVPDNASVISGNTGSMLLAASGLNVGAATRLAISRGLGGVRVVTLSPTSPEDNNASAAATARAVYSDAVQYWHVLPAALLCRMGGSLTVSNSLPSRVVGAPSRSRRLEPYPSFCEPNTCCGCCFSHRHHRRWEQLLCRAPLDIRVCDRCSSSSSPRSTRSCVSHGVTVRRC